VLPALVEAAATIGAAQIQNRATIGGNAMNASPAGDSLPVLLAADAEFVAGSGRGERTIPAAAFWVAYRRTALAPELVIFGSGSRLRFPKPVLLQPLMARRIGFETMDTAAACRTYNVLLAEGRAVVAALLFEAPRP